MTATALILDMIAADAFGLSGFEVVESSEQGMLSQVARAGPPGCNRFVFLGWEPHPMNAAYDMTYLAGGDDWFGANFGGAEVYTPNTRAGFAQECPNIGAFLNNLEFSLAMENEIMGAILNDGTMPEAAASAWLSANTGAIGPWLDGVTTADGGGRHGRRHGRAELSPSRPGLLVPGRFFQTRGTAWPTHSPKNPIIDAQGIPVGRVVAHGVRMAARHIHHRVRRAGTDLAQA